MPGGAPVFQLSGWWSRVGATLLDGLIVGIPALLFIPLLIAAGVTAGDNGAISALAIAALLVLGLAWLVFAVVFPSYWMSKTNGQTIGKQIVGIRVVRETGQPITFGYAMIREFAVKGLLVGGASNIVPFLPMLANYLWPLWDDQHRALHDMIVKTRVVQA